MQRQASKEPSSNAVDRAEGRVQVTYRPVSELKLDANNPRAHSPRQVRQIARSMETFGFIVPALIDPQLRVIAGHGRILACRLLGWTQVPTICLDYLSEAQAKVFAIADNRLSENSEWNDRLLGEQLKKLSELELDFSLEVSGFHMAEIDLRIEGLTAEPGDADPDDQAADPADGATQIEEEPASGTRLALAIGVIVVVGLAALTGWLGFRTYQSHQAEAQRNLFLEVGRQGALNLTTISYTEAEADVARILDSATGAFHDDFQKRSQPFIDVVKQAQSKTEGTVAAAGLESVNGDSAQVLVAVSVKTTNAGAPEQQPHAWRMRIDVQKVNDEVKVSNVSFVS